MRWWQKFEEIGKPLVEPDTPDRELAWRAYVLNTVVLALAFFTSVYFVFNLIFWFLGLDEGSAVATFFGVFIFLGIYLLSKKRSVRAAIYALSLFSIIVSFILSFGWGVADISTTAFYVMAIFINSILLRGRDFWLVLGTLVLGYFLLAVTELSGLFTPPFFTRLQANVVNVTVILIFLTLLGLVTSRLIDAVLSAQVAEARRRQELESRAKIAAEVQLKMLPARPPAHPYFEIAGQSIPAWDVGGDFYNYHLGSNGDLSVTIGDVTGKGMSAALLMAVTTGMIDSLLPVVTEPGPLLDTVAARLYKHSRQSGLNAACLVAFLSANRLRLANAGCISPVIWRANGQLEWVDIGGLPIGVTYEPNQYRQIDIDLTPGDWIIFTTDGVVETMNAAQHILGFEALNAIIASGPTHTAQALKTHIIEQVKGYQGDQEQHDDITVVVVRVKENSVYAA